MVCKHKWKETIGISSFGDISKKQIHRTCKLCGKNKNIVKNISKEEFKTLKKELEG